MRSTSLLSLAIFLAQQVVVEAVGLADSVHVLRHGAYIATRVRRKADANLISSDHLKRRVEPYYSGNEPNAQVITPVARDTNSSATNSTISPMPNINGDLNLNPTVAETQSACMSILATSTSTDDSGMTACYDVNFFDNSTGQFQTNMLLYKVASPSGSWTSLQPGSLHLSLSFPGASATMMVNSTQNAKRDIPTVVSKRSASSHTPTPSTIKALSNRSSNMPMLLEAYTIIGSMTGAYNSTAQFTNSSAMRQALTPNIIVSAMSENGTNLTSTMAAPTNAAFVDGYFSDAFIASKAAAAATPAPFTLPGVTLGMFPTGLIVTSSWIAIFIAVVGYGTLGRLQWRRAYRARKPTASGK